MSPRGESPQHSESAEASERPTKRAKKLPFFERLSDEERRQLRRKQRLVRVDLEVSQSQETIEQARALNNELFEEVDHTREAVLDAENVEAIASKYQAHAERLVQVPRFDPIKLVHELRSRLTDQKAGFRWKELGAECGVCYNALPAQVEFLCGPMDADLPEPLQRQRQRRVRQKAPAVAEIRPEAVQTTTKKVGVTEHSQKELKARLKERHREEKDDFDGVQFLFNPNSFVQTVENIFNFSFLIKKGEACIGQSDGSLRVGMRKPTAAQTQASQAVFSLTMSEWRELCQSRAMTQGDLPHRQANEPEDSDGKPEAIQKD